jgi:DNA-damage-inducible protein D
MTEIPHISNEIALIEFEKHPIRRFYDETQEMWYFSVIDVVAALTDSVNPRDYWFKMKIRVKTEDEFELSTICRQLKLKASDGKLRETDCATVEGLFRIIQSIPSPKAEPFKLWLAKVGYERIQDMNDPAPLSRSCT